MNYRFILITPLLLNACATNNISTAADMHPIGTNIVVENGEKLFYRIDDFYFLNDRQGYVINSGISQSTLKITANGGKDWRTKSIPPYYIITEVFFMDPYHGLITVRDNTGCPEKCAYLSYVLRSDDGGEHWALKRYPELEGSGPPHNIQQDDGQILFALNYYHLPSPAPNQSGEFVTQLIRSDDRGQSWSIIYKTTLGLTGKFEIYGDYIYAAQSKGTILVLDKQGNEKNVIQTPEDNYLWDFQVLSEKILFAVVSNNGEYELVRTLDGGRTWQVLYRDRGSIRIASFISPTVGSLVIDIDHRTNRSDARTPTYVIAYTQDAGAKWEESPILHSALAYQGTQVVNPRLTVILLLDRLVKIKY